jgi:hypothetical protein
MFKSEKQKAFFERIAAGKAKKQGEGNLSQDEAKSFIEHTKEEVSRPKFFKTMLKIKGKK